MAGSEKGACGEVEEEQGEGGVDEEVGVFGAEAVGGADGPQVLGEEQGEHGEEHACDFEPEDAAGMGKGVPQGGAEVAAAACDFTAAADKGAGLTADGLALA